jgi:hypothetical protein
VIQQKVRRSRECVGSKVEDVLGPRVEGRHVDDRYVATLLGRIGAGQRRRHVNVVDEETRGIKALSPGPATDFKPCRLIRLGICRTPNQQFRTALIAPIQRIVAGDRAKRRVAEYAVFLVSHARGGAEQLDGIGGAIL